MAQELVKGEKFNLSKESGGAENFYVGLGWSANSDPDPHKNYDLDVSAFGCTYNAADDPKLTSPGHFVYFKQLQSADNAIMHSEDNLTGEGDGDDEWIVVDLSKLDPRVQEISVVVNIYDAVKKGQNFGQVRKAYIRVCHLNADGTPGDELLKFSLSDDYSKFTAVHFGSIYKREDADWAFNAAGVGFENAGLSEILAAYS